MIVPLYGASPGSRFHSLSKDLLDENLDLFASQWSKIEEMWFKNKISRPYTGKLNSTSSPYKVSSSRHLGIHYLKEIVGYEVLPSSGGGLFS